MILGTSVSIRVVPARIPLVSTAHGARPVPEVRSKAVGLAFSRLHD